jgi:hypothetical protein
MKIGMNGSRRTAAGAGDNEDSADRLGEKREKEEEAADGLSFGLVAPQQSAQLSRTSPIGATQATWCHVGTKPHACPIGHASAHDVTSLLDMLIELARLGPDLENKFRSNSFLFF